MLDNHLFLVYVFSNILTICTGNICRSPLAEAMLRVLLGGTAARSATLVRSAGTSALVGRPADATVQAIAAIDPALQSVLNLHRALQVHPALTREADLILVMEPSHLQYVLRIDSTARGKTFLLGHWVGITSVGDPYMQHESVYREMHRQIEKAVSAWYDKLR